MFTVSGGSVLRLTETPLAHICNVCLCCHLQNFPTLAHICNVRLTSRWRTFVMCASAVASRIFGMQSVPCRWPCQESTLKPATKTVRQPLQTNPNKPLKTHKPQNKPHGNQHRKWNKAKEETDPHTSIRNNSYGSSHLNLFSGTFSIRFRKL